MNMIILNEVFLDLFDILYIAVILTTIFVVILDNRNPVKTMAWILVLFFLLLPSASFVIVFILTLPPFRLQLRESGPRSGRYLHRV